MARRSSDRKRRRKDADLVAIFSNRMALGLRQTNVMERSEAERRFRLGQAYRIFKIGEQFFAEYLGDARLDGGVLWGYVLCEQPKRTDDGPSRAFLSRREVDMAAGVYGDSITAFFGRGEAGEKQRQSYAEAQAIYRKRVVGMEDGIELAQAKLQGLHPLIGLQDRIVRVSPAPKH